MGSSNSLRCKIVMGMSRNLGEKEYKITDYFKKLLKLIKFKTVEVFSVQWKTFK